MAAVNLPCGFLDRSDCDRLNQLLASCAETQAVIDFLIAAGLDYSEQARKNRFQEQVGSKIKAAAFPNEP